MKESKILVVEDDELMLKAIKHVISRQHMDVTAVTNGQEALKCARKMIFDLVISDINMPLMNGHDFVKRFRQLPEYKLTPFIFLSGNNNKQDWVKGLSDGADDYLKKPFDPQLLIAKVNANLKRVQLQRQQLTITQAKNLGAEKGHVVFCTSMKKSYQLPTEKIKSEVIHVSDEQKLFITLEEKDTWLLLIDEYAGWPFRLMNKIKSIAGSKQIPLFVLVSKTTTSEKIEAYFESGATRLLFKDLFDNSLVHEINAQLERETAIKHKYLNAINIAAQNSPIGQNKEYNKQLNHFSLSCFHQSYQNIPGGDYYEVFHLGENQKLVAIGDVMGKEWGAWFFVAGYLAYLRSVIHFILNNNGNDKIIAQPGDILTLLNKVVYKDLQLTEAFSTFSLLFIDGESGEIEMASAGGLDPIRWNHASKKVSEVKIKGTLLGLVEDTQYPSVKLKLDKQDGLIICTDGYTESKGQHSDDMIGFNGVGMTLEHMQHQEEVSAISYDMLFKTQHQVNSFSDDRTLVFIKKLK